MGYYEEATSRYHTPYPMRSAAGAEEEGRENPFQEHHLARDKSSACERETRPHFPHSLITGHHRLARRQHDASVLLFPEFHCLGAK